jgi:hypothetical protein
MYNSAAWGLTEFDMLLLVTLTDCCTRCILEGCSLITIWMPADADDSQLPALRGRLYTNLAARMSCSSHSSTDRLLSSAAAAAAYSPGV